jgi:tRNA-specific 2-thiouridylase
MQSERKGKAVALYSGGFDSTLAILIMMKHGVEVEALKLLTPFACDINDSFSGDADSSSAAENFGFNVRLCHLGWKFVEMVKNPEFGYGRNMNPCIDCRILMLNEAKAYMENTKADFIITGEVLGQRPMSQMRSSLNLVTKRCGLEGRLVRPLSGRLFEPTIPEKEGLIKREWLLDISGRSRKRQMELAEEFGLGKYPNPAAGCLLTDKSYSHRLRDLFDHDKNFDLNDLNLLKFGRQFRFSERCKLIVGRNKGENEAISELAKDTEMLLEAKETGSPISLIRGEYNEESLKLAASITARYSDKKYDRKIAVDVCNNSRNFKLDVSPADDVILNKFRI